MKLNKKGFTLIELIVAISLISVVLLFLYSLISDVSSEIYNNSFALENQIDRFEIIEKVNSILEDKTITEVTSNDSTISIKIKYEDEDGTSEELNLIKGSDEDTFEITDGTSVLAKWTMDSSCYLGEFGFTKDVDVYKVYFEVYTYNSNNDIANNNSLDDYVFYFAN